MKIKHIFLLLVAFFLSGNMAAQTPTISPSVTFTDAEGNESSELSFSGSAPVIGTFKANPSNISGWTANYEWRFYTEGKEDSPYLVRYEENTEYTFTTSGSNYIVCYATFVQGTDTIAYTQSYWKDAGAISVSIYESKLEMPNAFSPNGDGINDIYKAKSGYQSIIEFHAYIFNRWGQKLYDWSDPSGGWDGKFKGKDVKDGVYFCLVQARGADGRKFNIKKDVNLLREYTETTNN
jgi:gliding motility-associated-like protein